MRAVSRKILLPLAVALALSVSTCDTETTPTPTPEPSVYAMEYLLLDAYPDYFYCDPDYWPIWQEGGEERNAIEQFPAIRTNAEEFAAILARLMLPVEIAYSPEEKLVIYREHKKLTYAIQMTPTHPGYDFSLHTSGDSDLCIQGSISFDGTINESKRETCFIDCPICLTKGTLVETPAGPVPVQEIGIGDLVWTLDDASHRVEGRIIETTTTPVPSDFEVVKVTLADGRTVTASPGHPTVDRRPLGDYRAGEILDGSPVAAVERVRYAGGSTYDLLPAGPTSAYWANRILLMSTLANGVGPGSGQHVASGHSHHPEGRRVRLR